MPATRRARAVIAAGACAALLAACTDSTGSPGKAEFPLHPTRDALPHSSVIVTPPARPFIPVEAVERPREQPTLKIDAASQQLPGGGTTILGRYRVVAYYGGPDGPALGALGEAPPEQMAAVIEQHAAQFARPGRPVLPAMELIATVAQGAPGPDGLYSRAIPHADVDRYLAVAHRHHMLLILDFQPGRGTFLPQVEQFADVLADPSVSLALDPEWKMGADQIPGTTIGSATADTIEPVVHWVSGLITRHHLPDKLLLVHQFTLRMLPDRQRITPQRGVEVVFHADGFGTQQQKLATWNALAFPGRPFGSGFKLFLRQDIVMMTPAQVLRLRPAPDVITYE